MSDEEPKVTAASADGAEESAAAADGEVQDSGERAPESGPGPEPEATPAAEAPPPEEEEPAPESVEAVPASDDSSEREIPVDHDAPTEGDAGVAKEDDEPVQTVSSPPRSLGKPPPKPKSTPGMPAVRPPAPSQRDGTSQPPDPPSSRRSTPPPLPASKKAIRAMSAPLAEAAPKISEKPPPGPDAEEADTTTETNSRPPPPPSAEEEASDEGPEAAAEGGEALESEPPPRSAAIDEEARARRSRRSLLSIPDDDVPPARTETSKQAIAAMRVITVGAPEESPPLSDEDIEPAPKGTEGDIDVTVEAPEEAPPVEAEAPPPVEAPSPPPTPEAPAEPVAPAEAAAQPEAGADAAEPEAKKKKFPKPPPPPKKKTGSLPTPDVMQRKRPWWEELFGDDFNRSHMPMSPKEVSAEVNFIEEALGVAKGGVLLDLACGSGHHAVELAGRGYGVVGYDLSLTQLALAADVAQEKSQKINFLQGDMREMAFEEMFDAVYCWNTSFGFFEEDKNVGVAQRVFKALRPGGMFLLDVMNRDFAVSHQPSSVWYEGDGCVCMDEMRVDFITSRMKVKRTVMLDDGRTLECNYSVRLYNLHELGRLLHGVGFRVSEVSGHPATPGVFFGSESPRIIILAERPADS